MVRTSGVPTNRERENRIVDMPHIPHSISGQGVACVWTDSGPRRSTRNENDMFPFAFDLRSLLASAVSNRHVIVEFKFHGNLISIVFT